MIEDETPDASSVSHVDRLIIATSARARLAGKSPGLGTLSCSPLKRSPKLRDVHRMI